MSQVDVQKSITKIKTLIESYSQKLGEKTFEELFIKLPNWQNPRFSLTNKFMSSGFGGKLAEGVDMCHTSTFKEWTTRFLSGDIIFEMGIWPLQMAFTREGSHNQFQDNYLQFLYCTGLMSLGLLDALMKIKPGEVNGPTFLKWGRVMSALEVGKTFKIADELKEKYQEGFEFGQALCEALSVMWLRDYQKETGPAGDQVLTDIDSRFIGGLAQVLELSVALFDYLEKAHQSEVHRYYILKSTKHESHLHMGMNLDPELWEGSSDLNPFLKKLGITKKRLAEIDDFPEVIKSSGDELFERNHSHGYVHTMRVFGNWINKLLETESGRETLINLSQPKNKDESPGV